MAAGNESGTARLLHVEVERNSQRVLIAFVLSGIFFLLLPGTFLGVWNLLRISERHGVGEIPQAWLQAHGQAQLFGWVGSLILGIGLYAVPKKIAAAGRGAWSAWMIWSLWTGGNALRWICGVDAWHWRVVLVVGASMEVVAMLLFVEAVRSHRAHGTGRAGGRRDGLVLWSRLVIAATVGLACAVLVNFGTLIFTAVGQSGPEVPHFLSQQVNLTVIWAAMVPMIWGFNARWLPSFVGTAKPRGEFMAMAYAALVIGEVLLWTPLWPWAAIAFLNAVVLSMGGLQLFRVAGRGAGRGGTLPGLYAGFVWWIRAAYGWAVVSCVLSWIAVSADRTGGYWGAARHAITVGFIATMVFAIAQRIMPAFCGMRVLWSRKLMIASLGLLSVGCVLRAIAEPLAYEGIARVGWKVLPVSAVLELAAVAIFVCNMMVTLMHAPPHVLRTRAQAAVAREGASV